MAIGKAQKAKEKRQTLYAVFLGALALAVMLVLGFYAITKESFDSRFCPSTTIPGHTVILIDKTDKLGFTQQQALLTDVSDVIKSLEAGTLVSIFALAANFESTATPILQLCSPGRFGKEDNIFTKSKSFTEKQFKERFEAPILRTVENLTTDGPEASSPILEMLQLVGIKGFKKSNVSSNLQLVIYSDFLHNTKNFSMYSTSYSFEKFIRSDYGRQSMPQLPDVAVDMRYFVHTPKFQNKENKDFWALLFKKAGSKGSVPHKFLEGG